MGNGREWMVVYQNMCQSIRACRSLSGEKKPGDYGKKPEKRASIKVQYDDDGTARSRFPLRS